MNVFLYQTKFSKDALLGTVVLYDRETKHFTILSKSEKSGGEFPDLSEGFARETGKITRVSSTEEQPFITMNYDENGNFTGGRTCGKTTLDYAIKKAGEFPDRIYIDYLPWMMEG